VPLQRQVVVTGTAARVTPEESAAYFRTRPRGGQIGAWASEQSAVIPSRQVLDDRFAELAARWPEGTEVPVPEHWGGVRVTPETVEFWQGRPDRLHDRLRYRRADSGWVVERLAP
jgi:pyridoxamine 5'-phosphate oxidase